MSDSVWQEDFYEHKERLSQLENEKQELFQKSDEEMTDEEEILMRFWALPSLEKARKCLEWEAHSYYQTETRLRRPRRIKEWKDAHIPDDCTDFFQDARLRLAVKFDEDLKQFVPMTREQFIEEARQSRTRHTNEGAAQNINDWESLKLKGPQLFKRGPSDELIQKRRRKNVYGIIWRLAIAKEEWGEDKAQLVNDPIFTAYQIKDGDGLLVVRLYDGDRFVDAWVGSSPPRLSDKKSFYFPTEKDNDETVAFRECPLDLYAEHLDENYAVPNIFCEFSANAKEFVLGLKRGILAASTDETRPVLCTVALELTPNLCRMISIDTYRLLVQEVDITCGDPWEDINERGEEVLLPRDFCAFVVKAMKKPIGEIHIKIGRHIYGNNQTVYVVQIAGEVKQKGEIKAVQFVTRCVEGQMVTWRRVIPEGEGNCTIMLDPKQTVTVLERLSAVAKLDAERVTCKLDGDRLEVLAYDPDANLVTPAYLPADISGALPDPAFAFNHKFALDWLSWQTEEVKMELTLALASFKLSAGRSLYVLLPMQLVT